MRPFVFSCDAHVAEPPDLFTSNLPAALQPFALSQVSTEKYRIIKIGADEALKVKLDFHSHKTGQGDGGPHGDEVDTKRRGARDIALRLQDMDRDGVDAELVFPSLGLLLPRIADRAGQRESCRIYNDWVFGFCVQSGGRLVPAAMIPCIDFDDALAECQRAAAKGFAAFCLWEGLDNYNDERWDPIFAFAAAQEIPLTFHVGVGTTNIRALKGPGSGLFNYTRQMNDAVDIIAQLVGGGVLDRNPKAQILFAEHSAGWLWGLAERMDEAYVGHAPVVFPKLSRMPSQIVREQVHCALQNDVGSVATRRGVGRDALLFATDYPHAEGTFPFSQKVIERMYAQNPDATREDFVAILGGNAARLFRHANLAAKVAERAGLVPA